MENNKEQNDVTKIPKKEVQKLESVEKAMSAVDEEEAILNAHKIERTSKNQLR